MVKRYICGCPDPGKHWVGERYVLASDFDGIAAELAECRNSRQREHDLRVTIAAALNELAALRKIVAAAARLRGINLTPADGDEKHG